MKNPQMFNQYEQIRKNNTNPMDLFKQMTSSYTPQQMASFMNFAQSMGVPNELLQQVQNNGINANSD